jgi:hypothetical protein
MPASKKTPDLIVVLALTIASGGRINDFAREHGVSVRTVNDWMHLPEYRAALDQARARVIDSALGKLVANLAMAVETVAELARSAPEASIRLSAARGLINDWCNVSQARENKRELLELRRRLDEIERGGTGASSPPGRQDFEG